MTVFLKPRAADDLLRIIIGSHQHNVIGDTIYLERLSVLANICPSSHRATQYAAATLKEREFQPNDEPLLEGEESTEAWADKHEATSSEVRFDDDGLLRFTTTAGGLGEWVFHPFDDDFFPSIPHGHLRKKRWGKLDAYLGWVYEDPSKRSQQSHRIKRKSIISLWNDDAFRDIASDAINYHLNKFPKFQWRVANPRKLPRKKV